MSRKEHAIDKDRVIGSADVIKGKVEEAVGKAIGDVKLESEAKADKIEGEVQNVVFGLKDTLRGEWLSGRGDAALASTRRFRGRGNIGMQRPRRSA